MSQLTDQEVKEKLVACEMNGDESLKKAVKKYGIENIMKFLLECQYESGWKDCSDDVAEGL